MIDSDSATSLTADLLIIGAGPGGYETAVEAVSRGERVVVVERDELGGTCLNRGCIPTKALCHSAAIAREMKAAGAPLPDFADAAKRRDEVVAELRSGVAQLMSNVELIRGEARFLPDGRVAVGTDCVIAATRTIIATGSAPALPASIAGVEWLMTSDTLLQLDRLPATLLMIGGGVIGLEFASIFASFGVEVTVVEFCPEILPGFDPEIAKRLRMALKRRGIKVMTSTEVISVDPDGHSVVCREKGRERTLEAEMAAIATGRRAVIPEGLADCGVAIGPRGILVDDRMMTSRHGIYAIGDCTGQIMLAHYAVAQGRRALGLEQDLTVVPSAVFTFPECAMTGLTEAAAVESGADVGVGRATFRANGKALADDATDGVVKVIVDRAADRLLGVHICGAHASDLIVVASTAMAAGTPASRLAAAIYPHPTLSEVLASALRSALS